LFNGKITHSGARVVRGRRLLLTGFVDYHGSRRRIAEISEETRHAGGGACAAKRSLRRPYLHHNVEELSRRSGASGRRLLQLLASGRLPHLVPGANLSHEFAADVAHWLRTGVCTRVAAWKLVQSVLGAGIPVFLRDS